MPIASYLVAILGLAVLMVVHEAGHYFAARKFGMRVVKFSIGFGPTIYKHQPAGSDTVFQIAIIPFLAYVQIAGMNPYEENDPDDPSSYLNASLWARVVTVAAGPLSNYFFASVLFFFGFMLAGRPVIDDVSMRVTVAPGGPAEIADIRTGDRVVAVDHEAVGNWEALKAAIRKHPGEPVTVSVNRDGKPLEVIVTPAPKGDKYEGKILIGPEFRIEKVGALEAARLSITEPLDIVGRNLRGIARMLVGKEKAEVAGPVGIVKDLAGAVRENAGSAFELLGAISACLAVFNLLPVPALDGGRLMFLAFEAITRRKPDAKIEARIHAIGLILMLTLVALVTYSDIMGR